MEASLDLLLIDVPERIHTERLILRCPQPGDGAALNAAVAETLDAWRAGWLEQAQALGCVAVITDYSMLDADAVARIHAAGMRALAYTVNDSFTARWLLGCGIDGLVTDAVDRFSPGDRSVMD